MKFSHFRILTLLLFVCWNTVYGQNNSELSKKEVLKEIYSVSPQAFLFYRTALKKDLTTAFEKGEITREEFHIYDVCWHLKDFIATKSFTECASYALRKLKDDDLPLWLKKMLAQCLTTSYFKMGMLDKGEQAQEYYYKLVKESEKRTGIPYTEYMISAEFYFDAKEYETAAIKYKEALYDHEENVAVQNNHFKGFLSNNIALCYLETKKYDSVLKYNNKARSYWNSADIKDNKDHFNALLDANLAMIYSAQGREEEAIPLLYHYMKGCKDLDYYHYVKSYVDLANVYVQLRAYDKAQGILDSLDQVVKLPVVDSKTLLQKYFTHYRIMNRQGNYDQAEKFLNQYLYLSEEKYNENKRKELKQYAMLYDIYEKQKELEFRKIESLESKQIQDEQPANNLDNYCGKYFSACLMHFANN